MTTDILEKLSKYGTVKTCKTLLDRVAIIVITEGFDQNAINTFSFIKDCTECFPKYNILETCITESGFAMIVLTDKK